MEQRDALAKERPPLVRQITWGASNDAGPRSHKLQGVKRIKEKVGLDPRSNTVVLVI